jgi:AraC family transcriptional regulator
MTPIIEFASEKKLVGKHMTMSYADYKIGELWRAFMPRRKEINNNVSNELISFVVYGATHFADYKSTNEFERWAAVEVENFDHVPDDLETYILPSGLFAVFHYNGLRTDSAAFFQYIYLEWLPNSKYQLDDRPHVEILGEKYKNNDPLSEEDVWIPIKLK